MVKIESSLSTCYFFMAVSVYVFFFLSVCLSASFSDDDGRGKYGNEGMTDKKRNR